MNIKAIVETEIRFFEKTDRGSILKTIKKDTLCVVKGIFYNQSTKELFYDIEFENGCFTYSMRIEYFYFLIGKKWIDLVVDGKYVKENDIKEDTIVIAELRNGEYKTYAFLKRVKESDVSWRTLDDNSELSYSWSVYKYMIVEEIK